MAHATQPDRPIEPGSSVTAGKAVSAAGADAVHFYPWPDTVYLPIRDAPRCEWAFVWRSANETPLIRALAEAAVDAPAP